MPTTPSRESKGINQARQEVKPMAETMAEILLERGIEQDERENAIKNILTVLAVRFSERDAEIAKHRLESILDLDRLTQLHRTAVNTPSFKPSYNHWIHRQTCIALEILLMLGYLTYY